MDKENVGRLKRYRVKGTFKGYWWCDYPNCEGHTHRERIDAMVLETDQIRAMDKALNDHCNKRDIYDRDDEELTVTEEPFGEDERMRMIDAPGLPGLEGEGEGR